MRGDGMRFSKVSIYLCLLAAVVVGLTACNNSAPTASSSEGTETADSTPVQLAQLNFENLVSPSEQNIDEGRLNNLIDEIERGLWGSVDSLLISRNGQMVLERYFRDYDGTTPHRMYSTTKSITSMLIGIAMDQGHIQSLDQKLLDFFPEYERSDILNYDERKEAITLEDVLTMRAGFEWNEHSTRYTTPNNPTTHLFASADWMKHMLDLPMATAPGTSYRYNSGATMLLSGILRNTTGMNTREFAEEFLFGPLGITNFDWEEGPEEIFNTGWGSFLVPRDMMKIGLMVLNDGVWEGQQIISNEWLNDSTSAYVPRGSGAYGFQWWMMPLSGVRGHTPTSSDIDYTSGWGGQHIFVIRHLDMVVTVTGENYNGAPRSAQSMIQNYIIPAVLDAEATVNSG